MTTPRTSPFPDFLNIEDCLTPDQKQIAGTVREFVSREAQPLIRQAFRQENFPLALIPKMADLGVFYHGLDPLSYGLAMRELERCDSGLRSFASVQRSLVIYPIDRFGSEKQKQQWLPLLESGQAIGCFGLTESEGGSDPGSMRTRAVDRGDHWLLNGSKMWITNGNLAQVAVVWAKTEQGIRGFLVPTDLPGFRPVKMQGKLSLRASITSELYFEDLKLPKEALLPGTKGLDSALSCLTQARFGIAWGVLGAAEACFDEAVRFVSERQVFGKKLAGFQLVQRKLAQMCISLSQAQLVALRVAQLKEKEELHYSQVSLAKQANVEMALNLARTARDLLGAHGITDEYSTMRHLCNLETVSTYEGTNDIHLLVVGRQITGLAAFAG